MVSGPWRQVVICFYADEYWLSCGKVRNDNSGIAGSAVSFSFPELPDREFRNRGKCDVVLNSGIVKPENPQLALGIRMKMPRYCDGAEEGPDC
jgi:hypothetical protein